MENIIVRAVRQLTLNNEDVETMLIDCDNQYVSDALSKEFKTWTPDTPVFITAPTGKGKNHFIENDIILDVQKKNRFLSKKEKLRVLIVSNRIALSRQQKIRIAKLIGLPKYFEGLSGGWFDREKDIDFITIFTYQHLSNHVHSKNVNWNDFTYVIFDECHFFASDSIFNAKTSLLLSRLPELFHNSIRIYMSATSEEVFKHIETHELLTIDAHYAEYREKSSHVWNWRQSRDPYSYSNEGFPSDYFAKLKHYKFASDYSRFNYKYFNDYNQLVDIVAKSKESEKWLFFVSSKNIGLILKGEFEESKISCEFISAESKDSSKNDKDTYDNLLDSDCFSERVLIATSVINNGINIKDAAVKHIVPMVYNKTEILQMVGRKRFDEGENEDITIYLQEYERKYLSHLKLRILQKIEICEECAKQQKNNNNNNVDINIFMQRESFFDNFFQNTINWYIAHDLIGYNAYSGEFFYNYLAYEQLKSFANLLDETIKQKDEGISNACILKQLEWFDLQDTYEECNWIDYESKEKGKSKLNEFLNRNLEIQMEKKDQEQFRKAFTSFCIEGYGTRENDRSNTIYGLKIINDRLAETGLPYEVVSQRNDNHEKTIWILKNSELKRTE